MVLRDIKNRMGCKRCFQWQCACKVSTQVDIARPQRKDRERAQVKIRVSPCCTATIREHAPDTENVWQRDVLYKLAPVALPLGFGTAKPPHVARECGTCLHIRVHHGVLSSKYVLIGGAVAGEAKSRDTSFGTCCDVLRFAVTPSSSSIARWVAPSS